MTARLYNLLTIGWYMLNEEIEIYRNDKPFISTVSLELLDIRFDIVNNRSVVSFIRPAVVSVLNASIKITIAFSRLLSSTEQYHVKTYILKFAENNRVLYGSEKWRFRNNIIELGRALDYLLDDYCVMTGCIYSEQSNCDESVIHYKGGI